MENEESIGEGEIRGRLEHLGIRFEQYKPIFGLRDDRKRKRIADFYLPDYDVYIEFLGLWNKNKERRRYREKMRVYKITILSVFTYGQTNCT
jgi:hypothetical protein